MEIETHFRPEIAKGCACLAWRVWREGQGKGESGTVHYKTRVGQRLLAEERSRLDRHDATRRDATGCAKMKDPNMDIPTPEYAYVHALANNPFYGSLLLCVFSGLVGSFSSLF